MRPPELFAVGLLHGPAELLPVSSSAHVALLLSRLGPEERKELEVAVHFGTLCALGVPRPRLWLVASTLPPAVVGLALERRIERMSSEASARALIVSSLPLALADVGEGRRAGAPTLRDCLVVGLAQTAALVPGVSRLGATLTALRLMGFDRRAAHAVSVEASRPVLLGATLLKGARVLRRRGELAPLAVCAAGSWLSTRVALRALGGRALPLWPFALYRAALGGSVLRMARRPTAADV